MRSAGRTEEEVAVVEMAAFVFWWDTRGTSELTVQLNEDDEPGDVVRFRLPPRRHLAVVR